MSVAKEHLRKKKLYYKPCIVDFGGIEAMTGDCWGFCADGTNGGEYWGPRP